MVLMNEDMYNWCEKMEIDEKKEVINISDHCLINVKYNIRGKDKNKFRKIEWEEEEYYKKDQEAMEEFRKEMMEKWRGKKVEKVDVMISDMIEGAEKTLLKKVKRRVGVKGEEKVREREWMNPDIREEIKKEGI